MTNIPLDLLDYSPFEPRETIEPLETDGLVIEPLVVRPRASRFEVVAGHRRLETLRLRGEKEAPCRVLDLDDEEAALALYNDNQDRRDFSDYERGPFFQRFMEKFGISEREAGLRLRVSHTTISLCLGILQARSRVVIGTTIGGETEIYQRVMTTNKFKEVNRLSGADKTPALQSVAENHLSTEETKNLVMKIESGQTVGMATNSVLLRRETIKPERYAERKRRIKCPTCKGRGYLLKDETK